MTDLLVLGGSGRTGMLLLQQATARGHRVRALVRDPRSVQALAGIDIVQGTPASIDDLRKAADGAQAVISVLNNARASDNPWAKPISPPAFMTTAARDTLAVMGEQDIQRIVVASTQGAGNDWAHLNPVARALIKASNIKVSFADHDGVDRLVRASQTDWTLARAVALTDKPSSGQVKAAERGSDKPGAQISRATFASFLIDAVENDTWIRRAPLVWNS